ncbi:UvrD-helicase domain-containing protein [Brachybacterium halotolerans subsp. kimchii]|uniref:UvrD-helicase domain-containing protein n=1 Tax=Brachybacterium halotolerans TaxID=2795215 RepID=UPI001E599F1F|nr:UvrD-helicase domain-containing protein [Brachybacterium halotolerans]UEJ81930.1 UvrD-helicase domain-containing protein [Brachybacterium halotolerans subsp. kimchii]
MMSFTLINASAGSGKTHTLTQEIADRMSAGLEPSQLIATTFTVKAADELSDRVRRTLLEREQTEAARGIDSALIGTVNAVAGELVREFALDAGISPDVQVLDQDRASAAFDAAIDEAVARAGERASDLLARTEHDGEKSAANPFAPSSFWRDHVRDLASRARTNDVGADQLRRSADASWDDFRAAALPEPGTEDRRRAWLGRLDTVLDGLQAEVDGAAGGTPQEQKSAGVIAKRLETLRQLRRTLGQGARTPWSAWAKLARVAAGKAADPEGGGTYVYSKDVDTALVGLALEIAEELPAHPVMQRDIRGLIELVVTTAADSLEAYAQFKNELALMDFIDQEVLALHLLRTSERARYAIGARFRLLAVDEFQDTSPIQLALFLELGRQIEDLIWVGDPKQAIYGFRDADPDLMRGVLEAVSEGGTELGEGTIRDLEHSWRSQEQVLDLVSAVFPQVFPDLPRERVVLAAAPEAAARRAEAGRIDGRIEAWIPAFSSRHKSAPEHAAAIADGVVRMLAEDEVGPGDIAVLVRSNAQAAQVVSSLQARGVPASGQGGSILGTREGRLVRAALAVTLDVSDSLALTELVDLLPDHPAHESWFGDLTAPRDREGRREVLQSWWEADVLAGLRALREDCIALSPVEMIAAVIDALDLTERMRSWPLPEQRLRTLDALRRLAADFADQARSASAPITLTGLRAVLDETEAGPDLTGIPDTVWVGTIHGAKGLEWSRVVVMLPAKATERAHTGGVFVIPAEELDALRPLDGRSLRYWPRVLDGYSPLQELLAEAEHPQRAARKDREEAGRLQYVALTRAADVTVLSGDGTGSALDALVDGDAPLLTWEAGTDRVHVSDHGDLPARVRTTAIEGSDETDGPASRVGPRSPLAATDLPPGPRTGDEGRAGRGAGTSARFQASGVASDESLGTVHPPRSIGAALVSGGGRDWNRVGEAVHAFLALPLAQLTPALQEQAALRLVERWAVSRAVGAETLLAAGRAWQEFLSAEFPGARVLTEQPIAWWNEEEQVMEGWIDALLALPDGSRVLVDHKTYPGSDPVGHVREHYLGQMATYAAALEATGGAPARILIHLPLRGEVLEVTLREQTSKAAPALGAEPATDPAQGRAHV